MSDNRYLTKDEMSSIVWYIENTLLPYTEIADIHSRSRPAVLRVRDLFLTALASRLRAAIVRHFGNEKSTKRGPVLTRNGYYRSHTPSWWKGTECASGYVLSHVLICCKRHGLNALPKDMVVHHINGIRTDNRWYNLQLMPRSEHIKLHNIARDSWKCLKKCT